MAASANPSPAPATDRPPRPRRWAPLSLRLFAAILCAVGAWTGIRAYRQHAAIREIERLGGMVVTREVGPAWLRAWVGDNRMRLLEDVVAVQLDLCSTVTDGDLAQLRAFPWLEDLVLTGDSSLTDAGLRHLSGLTNLRALNLESTAITDAGLAELNRLTALEHLSLMGTGVTDAGTGQLAALTNLKQLELTSTNVTGSGFAKLKGLTHLAVLDLQETELTDEGVEQLTAFPRLWHLAIASPHVTDAGVAHLKGMTSLRTLGLVKMQLTDAGLAELDGLTGLRKLSVHFTNVTEEGVTNLQAALPKLVIAGLDEQERALSNAGIADP